jgi:hypothetical protein
MVFIVLVLWGEKDPVKTEAARVRFRTRLNRLLGPGRQYRPMTSARQSLPLWAPLVGAAAGLLALVPFHIAIGAGMGWAQAEKSGQIGWAILSVPAGPFMLILGVKQILPHIAALVAIWVITATVILSLLKPPTKGLEGAMLGVLIGLPGSLAAVAMSVGRTEDIAESIGLSFPLPVLFGALSLIACAVAGATVASIARRRRVA